MSGHAGLARGAVVLLCAVLSPFVQQPNAQARLATQDPAKDQRVGDATADLPPADELLRQTLDAIGSATAIERITSRESHGYMQTPNGEITVAIFSGPAGKFLIRQTLPGDVEVLFGSDGSTLWTRDSQGSYRLLDPSRAAQIRQFDCLCLVDDLMSRYPTRQTIGRETINGHDVYRVKLVSQSSADQVDVFIDSESKALRGKEYNRVVGAGGIIRMRYLFDDWKQFGDVKLFTKVAVMQDEQPAGSITLADIKHNSVDAAAFALPAEVQNLLKGPGAPPPPPPPGSSPPGSR